MKPFAHVIITRFNIHASWAASIDSQAAAKRLDATYLNDRFAIFEQFCLRSMQAQTEQDFVWVVLFDSDTPDQFKARIRTYQASYANFHPLFVAAGTPIVPSLVDYLKAHVSGKPQFLMTTRVDNDDALSNAFVATVQRRFARQENGFVFLIHGYMLRDGRLFSRTYRDNPFATRILKVDWDSLADFEGNPTVYVGQHGELAVLGSAEYVNNPQPAWLQVLHNSNVGNYLPKHCIRRPVSTLTQGFPHLKETIAQSKDERRLPMLFQQIPSTALYAVWRLPIVRTMKRAVFNR